MTRIRTQSVKLLPSGAAPAPGSIVYPKCIQSNEETMKKGQQLFVPCQRNIIHTESGAGKYFFSSHHSTANKWQFVDLTGSRWGFLHWLKSAHRKRFHVFDFCGCQPKAQWRCWNNFFLSNKQIQITWLLHCGGSLTKSMTSCGPVRKDRQHWCSSTCFYVWSASKDARPFNATQKRPVGH